MEQEIHQPDHNDNDEMTASLESYLRDLIEIDPDNFQAKLKLSRLLLNKGAIQEAKFFIEEVEQSEKLQNNALKLEMLGSLYMNPHMSKISIGKKPSKSTDSYIGVAMDKFLGAISDTHSDTDDALWGLGMNLKTVAKILNLHEIFIKQKQI